MGLKDRQYLYLFRTVLPYFRAAISYFLKKIVRERDFEPGISRD